MNLDTVISCQNATALQHLFCLRLYVEKPCISLNVVIVKMFRSGFPVKRTPYSQIKCNKAIVTTSIESYHFDSTFRTQNIVVVFHLKGSRDKIRPSLVSVFRLRLIALYDVISPMASSLSVTSQHKIVLYGNDSP